MPPTNACARTSCRVAMFEVPAHRVARDAHVALLRHVTLLAGARGLRRAAFVTERAVAPLEVRRLLGERLRSGHVRRDQRVARPAQPRLLHVCAVRRQIPRVHAHRLEGRVLVGSEDLALAADRQPPREARLRAEAVGLRLMAHRARHAIARQRLLRRRRDRRCGVPAEQRVVVNHRSVASEAQPLDLRALLRRRRDFLRHLRAPVGVAERVRHHRPLPGPVRRHVVAGLVPERERALGRRVAQGAGLSGQEMLVGAEPAAHALRWHRAQRTDPDREEWQQWRTQHGGHAAIRRQKTPHRNAAPAHSPGDRQVASIPVAREPRAAKLARRPWPSQTHRRIPASSTNSF